MRRNYPSIMMKVKKNLYRDEKLKFWSIEKRDNTKETVESGRFLVFRNYWYSIINPVSEDDVKNSMTIIMDIIDSISNQKFPLGQIEIHPYELNELIKEDAIEII